jgi:hypothetical protein
VKRLFIVCTLIVSICLSVFVGHYLSNQNALKDRDIKRQTLISFAISKVEDLRNRYDTDTMEALIGNVYAAAQFTDDSDLSTALHDLWNALIFDGENIIGKEDDLIKALKDTDPNIIKGLAYSIRQVN